MSIDAEINLDAIADGAWAKRLDQWGEPTELVTLSCSPAGLERAREALLALRGRGAPAMLLLAAKNTLLDDEELGVLFATLREWDQLSLRNFLELCQDWIPAE